ncbi:unnamed protein product [Phaedon cochleariae]|uniref:Major facilitator superfamily (MFS) profile domain-containing protein n=1 Tax=Phaedon cochleariae TaxID=80249 RepID=A0A9N9SAL2_PHACE|nr:unnamed protein product [Phaedon cochleariae]
MAMVSTSSASKPFEEAVTLTGFGLFNLYTLLVTGGCLMCVIIETMSAMFIIPAAQCDLQLSLEEKGILYSISFFGVVSSSHLWGFLADTRGRKMVVLVSLVLSCAVSLVGSQVSATWLFIALRFLNGFLIGGSSAIIYAYAGEFHDNKYRPKVVSWIATFVALGNVFLPGMAWLILPLEITPKSWRILMIVYSLPSLLFAILAWFLPESPKYLLTQGKNEEALTILKKMFSLNTGKKSDEYPVASILSFEGSSVHHEKNERWLRSMWEQTIPLFKITYLTKTLMVSYLHFAIFLTSSSVIMWYPQILNSMSEYGKIVPQEEVTICKSILYEEEINDIDAISSNSTIIKSLVDSNPKMCNDIINEEVFLVTMLVGASFGVCYICIGTFINITGTRRLLLGFVIITTISGICAQFLSGYTYILIALGIFLLVSPTIGIVNAVIVDLYPTEIRGMALAVSLMFGRLGAMAGSNITGPLMYNVCDYMLYIFAAIHVLVIIVIYLLPSKKSTFKEEISGRHDSAPIKGIDYYYDVNTYVWAIRIHAAALFHQDIFCREDFRG